MATILIVENEPKIAEFIVKGLRRDGYECLIEENQTNVLDRVISDNIDLILLDLGKLDTNAVALLNQLRETVVQIPVIVMTVRQEIERAQIIELGAKELIKKPFRFKELLMQIHRYV
ncbi:MAG: response regulator transcription factor [Leptolyngbyaceae cyanobacterium]